MLIREVNSKRVKWRGIEKSTFVVSATRSVKALRVNDISNSGDLGSGNGNSGNTGEESGGGLFFFLSLIIFMYIALGDAFCLLDRG